MSDRRTQDPAGQANGAFLPVWLRYYPRPADFRSCWVCQKPAWPGGISLGTLGPPGAIYLCGAHHRTVEVKPLIAEARFAAQRARLPPARKGRKRGRAVSREDYDEQRAALLRDYPNQADRVKVLAR